MACELKMKLLARPGQQKGRGGRFEPNKGPMRKAYFGDPKFEQVHETYEVRERQDATVRVLRKYLAANYGIFV